MWIKTEVIVIQTVYTHFWEILYALFPISDFVIPKKLIIKQKGSQRN